MSNPNRVALLRQLAARWPRLMLVASNAGAKLLEELWNQRKPSPPVPGRSDQRLRGAATLPTDRCDQAGAGPCPGHGHVLRLIPSHAALARRAGGV
jgi:hypothetical protein